MFSHRILLYITRSRDTDRTLSLANDPDYLSLYFPDSKISRKEQIFILYHRFPSDCDWWLAARISNHLCSLAVDVDLLENNHHE